MFVFCRELQKRGVRNPAIMNALAEGGCTSDMARERYGVRVRLSDAMMVGVGVTSPVDGDISAESVASPPQPPQPPQQGSWQQEITWQIGDAKCSP